MYTYSAIFQETWKLHHLYPPEQETAWKGPI